MLLPIMDLLFDSFDKLRIHHDLLVNNTPLDVLDHKLILFVVNQLFNVFHDSLFLQLLDSFQYET